MELIGEFSALSAALLWSFSSILFTSLSIQIGTLQLNLWRLILAAILVLLTLSIAGIPYNLTQSQLIWLCMSGIAGLVLGDTFLFAAFKESGPRLSMLIMSCNPAIAAILAFVILKEKIGFYGIAGMIVTLIGIFLVVLQNQKGHNERFRLSMKGILYGFLAAVGQATGLILAKMAFVEGEVNGLLATEVRIVSAVIILMPAMIIMKRFINPIHLFGSNPKLIGKITLGSIIGPYLGITLSYIAIINTEIGIAATLMSLTPLILIPLSVIFYKEKINFAAILGTLIAFVGVAVLFLK